MTPFREAAEQGQLYTTGYWYWRLARAIGHPSDGALSRALSGRSEDEQRRVFEAMHKLPDRIGIVHLRRLVPIMAALPGSVNVLTAEAVATAVLIDGSIAVTTESEMLNRVAGAASVPVELVRLG